MTIRTLIEDFTNQLSSLLEQNALDRARAAVESALGSARAGRPPKLVASAKLLSIGGGQPRAKQLCPVPGCKNPAAPVFGMVCSKHKDLPKTKIAKFRQARRAKKQKTTGRRAAA